MLKRDLFRLAVDNLRRNRSRTVLTLVGVAVGAAALLTLLAYGAGVQEHARQEFEALELYNTLRVTSQPSPLAGLSDLTNRPSRHPAEDAELVPLTDTVVTQLAYLPGVLTAYPEMVFPVELYSGGHQAIAQAEAVPLSFGELDAYAVEAGRYFEASDEPGILISTSMAERLGFEPVEVAVGREVRMDVPRLDMSRLMGMGAAISLGTRTLPLDKKRHQVTIVGLTDQGGSVGAGFFRVLLPMDYAAQLEKLTFFSTMDLLMRRSVLDTGYAAVRVQLDRREAYEGAVAAIEEMGLYVTGFREQFQQLERLFVVMDLALGIVGLIALLVATVGIANTMMMNVMERQREIGIIKAVGGEEHDVRRLFVVEGALLGLVGGLCGLVAGWLVTLLLGALVDVYIGRFGLPTVDIFYVSFWMLLGILALSVGVALGAALWPARKAARLAPLEALRA